MDERAPFAVPGRFREGAFEMPQRIYYAETDAGGIVYHAAYLTMAERCRAEMLRALGLPLVAPDGAAFVARRAAVEWRRPARLDDLLICATTVVAIGAASLALRHRFLLAGQECARIELSLAHIDATGRPRRLPQPLREAFAALTAAP